eukprot:scpid26348/ scgid4125/ 
MFRGVTWPPMCLSLCVALAAVYSVLAEAGATAPVTLATAIPTTTPQGFAECQVGAPPVAHSRLVANATHARLRCRDGFSAPDDGVSRPDGACNLTSHVWTTVRLVCSDIDECLLAQHDCSDSSISTTPNGTSGGIPDTLLATAICQNVPGSYVCRYGSIASAVPGGSVGSTLGPLSGSMSPSASIAGSASPPPPSPPAAASSAALSLSSATLAVAIIFILVALFLSFVAGWKSALYYQRKMGSTVRGIDGGQLQFMHQRQGSTLGPHNAEPRAQMRISTDTVASSLRTFRRSFRSNPRNNSAAGSSSSVSAIAILPDSGSDTTSRSFVGTYDSASMAPGDRSTSCNISTTSMCLQSAPPSSMPMSPRSLQRQSSVSSIGSSVSLSSNSSRSRPAKPPPLKSPLTNTVLPASLQTDRAPQPLPRPGRSSTISVAPGEVTLDTGPVARRLQSPNSATPPLLSKTYAQSTQSDEVCGPLIGDSDTGAYAYSDAEPEQLDDVYESTPGLGDTPDGARSRLSVTTFVPNEGHSRRASSSTTSSMHAPSLGHGGSSRSSIAGGGNLLGRGISENSSQEADELYADACHTVEECMYDAPGELAPDLMGTGMQQPSSQTTNDGCQYDAPSSVCSEYDAPSSVCSDSPAVGGEGGVSSSGSNVPTVASTMRLRRGLPPVPQLASQDGDAISHRAPQPLPSTATTIPTVNAAASLDSTGSMGDTVTARSPMLPSVSLLPGTGSVGKNERDKRSTKKKPLPTSPTARSENERSNGGGVGGKAATRRDEINTFAPPPAQPSSSVAAGGGG